LTPLFLKVACINDDIQQILAEKNQEEYEGMESRSLGFSKTSIGCILFTDESVYEKKKDSF
jgi:hypothetical protein